MVGTFIRRAVCAVLLGIITFLAADTADAGCGWLHRHHGNWTCGYSSWGGQYGGYGHGYSDVGFSGHGYGAGYGGIGYGAGYGAGYGGSGYGNYGYSRIGPGAVYDGLYGAGYYQPRYYTRLDYPQNWGWSDGFSGRHIWGHWYQDGGIWGVPSVSAAIRAYGPSRYYNIPSYQGVPYGTPNYGGASIYHGAEAERPAAGSSVVATPPEAQVASADVSGSALLTVAVPDEARVYVNGRQTTSRGAIRKFESSGLQPGHGYAYEVRAEVERNGRRVSDVQKVDMRAGETRNLVFDFGASQAAETSLTLRVPADAKVELAGRGTATTGVVRTYTTTGLGAGQGVPNYTVRVAVERFGRVLVKEQTVHLQAGQNTDLAFDFEEGQLADARR